MPKSSTNIYYNAVSFPDSVRVIYKAKEKFGKMETFTQIYVEKEQDAANLIAEWNAESVDYDFELVTGEI